VKLKGGASTEPSNVAPLKKETLVTVPELTVASAEIATSAGAVNTVPFAGLVILTVGDGGVGELTVMATTAEVLDMPAAVAMAVRE
jgi:hypothetical protein